MAAMPEQHDDLTTLWILIRKLLRAELQALDEAPERGWTVVDMRRDWRQVFTP